MTPSTDVQVFDETDHEDDSGWTYGEWSCPFRNSAELDRDWTGCNGMFFEPMDLIGHMQTWHDVDHDR